MENISKEYTRVRRDSDIYTDTAAEYSLPDYNGDIKRVLYTSATMSPASKFNDDEGIGASGVVTYDVIYVNAENKIDHITFTSDYDISAKLRSENIVGADIQTRISSYSHRLCGPRRINMKASLTSEVRITESSAIDTEINAPAGDAEYITKSLNVSTCVFAHSAEREYAEAIMNAEGVMEDEIEIIYTAAYPVFDEISVAGGEVNIKGSFNVSELIKCGEASPILYKKKIPFEELVECEGMEENMVATAYANINSISSSVAADESGVSVAVSVIAEYCVRGVGNKEVRIVRDAYLKSSASEVSYEDFAYSTYLTSDKKVCTLSHTVPLSNICEGGIQNIIYTSATAKLSGIELSDASAKIGMEMKLQGISADIDESGAENYHPIKYSFAAEEKVSFGCQIPSDSHIDCRVEVSDTIATIDEENMYIDVSYVLFTEVYMTSKEVRMRELLANPEEKFEKRNSEIIVYYPEEGDTLFSVARMFHTSAKQIAADNMLSQNVIKDSFEQSGLAGIKKLIIK